MFKWWALFFGAPHLCFYVDCLLRLAVVFMQSYDIDEELSRGSSTERSVGATMVEYAILVALIAIVSVVSLQFLGQTLSTTFSTIASTLQ